MCPPEDRGYAEHAQKQVCTHFAVKGYSGGRRCCNQGVLLTIFDDNFNCLMPKDRDFVRRPSFLFLRGNERASMPDIQYAIIMYRLSLRQYRKTGQQGLFWGRYDHTHVFSASVQQARPYSVVPGLTAETFERPPGDW